MLGRPRLTLAAVALLTIVCALLALHLQPATGIDTLVSSSSADYRATQLDDAEFGAAPVVVLVRLPFTQLLASRDLTRISELEACLDAQQLRFSRQLGALEPVAAAHAAPYGGPASPCARLMRLRPAEVVYGPGTFLNRAVTAVTSEIRTLTAAAAKSVQNAEAAALQLARSQGLDAAQAQAAAREAGALTLDRQLGTLSKLAGQTGISSTPSIDSSSFLDQIVFRAGGQTPKPRFAYLFPSAGAALIQVRLRAGLSDAQQQQAIALIRGAVSMPRFALPGGSYLVTGEPVVLSDLAGGISHQLALLLIGAALVMAVVLVLGVRERLRLLPLALALAAAAITFGLASLVGATLTMAAVAALPVLVGLGVDYAVQLQARTDARSVAVASLATASGFLVLLLSPVPMVRGFGLLLVVGVGVALVIAVVCVPAVIGALGERPAESRERMRRRNRPIPALSALLSSVTSRARLVVAIGVVLAIAGWALDTQLGVQSDITKLVPGSLPALRDLERLERITGVSGEIDVAVRGADVATPRAVAWMTAYERRVLAHFGYSSSQSCARATLCPALSLPDLFQLGTGGGGTRLRQSQIDTLLAAVPAYFRQAVITADRRSATLAFGIRLMPLSRQRQVVSYLRSQLHPPAGLHASLAGLPVLAADADGALSSPARRLLSLLAGLAVVGGALLLVLRDLRRALVPLAPIVLATGWSTLLLYALGVTLNPMSASLGVLVIAVATEFSVLLAERVRLERGDGWSPAGAIERAYRSTGAAIAVSGITAICGFGVLVVSNITMLREFGLVTLIDLGVSLAGVLLVLPAVISIAEPRPAIRLRRPAAPTPSRAVPTP